MILTERDLERFEKYYIPEPNTGCFIWLGSLTRGNYGQFSVQINNKWLPRRAPRIAWLLYKGEIPNKTEVCHTCDNPLCCNVDHLFLGSKSDNMIDCVLKNRHGGRLLKLKTHCKHGHEFNEKNTRIDYTIGASGKRFELRVCRTCINNNSERYRKKKLLNRTKIY